MKFIKFAGVMIIVLSLMSTSVYAHTDPSEQFHFKLSSEVIVQSGGELAVTQTYRVQNLTVASLKDVELALISDDAENTQVEYLDGQSIAFNVVNKKTNLANRDFAHKSLVLDIAREFRGKGREWSFKVSYTTKKPLQQSEGSTTLVLPFLDGRVGASWNLEVLTPVNLPPINYQPKVTEVSRMGKMRKFRFVQADFSEALVGLSFAQTTSYELQFSRQLRNNSLLPKTYTVTLPPDLHAQSTIIKSLESQPSSAIVDKDGNVLALYRLLPFTSKTISVKAVVQSSQVRYDFSKLKSSGELPDSLRYLIAPGEYWGLNDDISKAALALAPPEARADIVLKNAVNFINTKVIITDEPNMPRRRVDEVLSTGKGNDLNAADLLVALLRKRKIPARVVVGLVTPSLGLGDEIQRRAWTEAYVTGVGWVTLDPRWSRLFGSFGYSSSNRIAELVVGDDISGAQIADLISSSLPAISVISEPFVRPAESEFEFSAKRFVWLPGVYFDTTILTNSQGVIVDGVKLAGEDLGSVAPFELIKRNRWSFGEFKAPVVTAEFGVTKLEVVARPNWWPAITTGVIIFTVCMVQFYSYRKRKYLSKRFYGQVLH